MEREPGSMTNKLYSQQPQQKKEEYGDDEEFTVVNRKKTVRRQKKVSASADNPKIDRPRSMRPARKQAIILDRPTGNSSYTDMVRKVKKTVLEKNLT